MSRLQELKSRIVNYRVTKRERVLLISRTQANTEDKGLKPRGSIALSGTNHWQSRRVVKSLAVGAQAIDEVRQNLTVTDVVSLPLIVH